MFRRQTMYLPCLTTLPQIQVIRRAVARIGGGGLATKKMSEKMRRGGGVREVKVPTQQNVFQVKKPKQYLKKYPFEFIITLPFYPNEYV